MIIILIAIAIILVVLLMLILHDEKRQNKENTLKIKGGKIWQGRERRQFVRINAEIGVRYEATTDNLRLNQATSRDLSLGGVNLALLERIPKGTFLRMELDLPTSPKPLFVKGEVMWSREVIGSVEKLGKKLFATGIRFKRLDASDQTLLNNFIQEKAKLEESKEVKA
jgi:c-di-GMP-binding flagellar brake protein YcgR